MKSIILFLFLCMFWAVSVQADTLIFSDHFVGSVDTALTAHTPETGTGWTEEVNTTTSSRAELDSSGTNVEGDPEQDAVGMMYSAQPNPSINTYNIVAVHNEDVTVGVDDCVGVFGRFTDSNNYYSAGWCDDTGTNGRLYKKVAGVSTQLGSNGGTFINGSTIKLEIRNATKKVYDDGVEVISSTDNALTSAGKVGLWWGDMQVSGDGFRTNHMVDLFTVTEVPVSTRRIIIISHAGRWYLSPVIVDVDGWRKPLIGVNRDCAWSAAIADKPKTNEKALVYVYCDSYDWIGNENQYLWEGDITAVEAQLDNLGQQIQRDFRAENTWVRLN